MAEEALYWKWARAISQTIVNENEFILYILTEYPDNTPEWSLAENEFANRNVLSGGFRRLLPIARRILNFNTESDIENSLNDTNQLHNRPRQSAKLLKHLCMSTYGWLSRLCEDIHRLVRWSPMQRSFPYCNGYVAGSICGIENAAACALNTLELVLDTSLIQFDDIARASINIMASLKYFDEEFSAPPRYHIDLYNTVVLFTNTLSEQDGVISLHDVVDQAELELLQNWTEFYSPGAKWYIAIMAIVRVGCKVIRNCSRLITELRKCNAVIHQNTELVVDYGGRDDHRVLRYVFPWFSNGRIPLCHMTSCGFVFRPLNRLRNHGLEIVEWKFFGVSSVEISTDGFVRGLILNNGTGLEKISANVLIGLGRLLHDNELSQKFDARGLMQEVYTAGGNDLLHTVRSITSLRRSYKIWKLTGDMSLVRFDLVRSVCASITETGLEISIPNREPGDGLHIVHRVIGEEISIGCAFDGLKSQKTMHVINKSSISQICDEFRNNSTEALICLDLIVRMQSTFTDGGLLFIDSGLGEKLDQMMEKTPYPYDEM